MSGEFRETPKDKVGTPVTSLRGNAEIEAELARIEKTKDMLRKEGVDERKISIIVDSITAGNVTGAG